MGAAGELPLPPRVGGVNGRDEASDGLECLYRGCMSLCCTGSGLS